MTKLRDDYDFQKSWKHVKEIACEHELRVNLTPIDIKKYKHKLMSGVDHFRIHTNLKLVEYLTIQNKNWFQDPLVLSSTCYKIYMTLIHLMDWKNTVKINITDLSKKTGITRRLCYESISQILAYECFMIQIEKGKYSKPNVYMICPVYASKGNDKDLKEVMNIWRDQLKSQLAKGLLS
jgi:hypothetical protein